MIINPLGENIVVAFSRLGEYTYGDCIDVAWVRDNVLWVANSYYARVEVFLGSWVYLKGNTREIALTGLDSVFSAE
jgi:hypothetical protein